MKQVFLIFSLMLSGIAFTFAQTLDTLTYPLDRASGFSVFSAPGDSGFIAGTNSIHFPQGVFGTLQVGNNYEAVPGTKVTGVFVWFAGKKRVGAADNYAVNVYNTGADSLPTGQPLDTETFNYNAIDTPQTFSFGNINFFDFPNDPQVNGRFFVSVETDGPTRNDTIGLVTNNSGDGLNEERAGMELSQGVGWLKFDDLWGTQQAPINVDLVILPVVELQQSSTFDAGIDSVFRGGYTSYPENHTAPITLEADIRNFGNQTVTNPSLQVDVIDLGNQTVVFSGSQSGTSIAPGNTTRLTLNNTFTPSDTGAFAIRYISSINGNDNNPSNDTTVAFIAVDDSVYARDDALFSGTLDNSLGVGTGASIVMGQNYDVQTTDSLTTVSFFVTGATIGDTTQVEIYNTSGNTPSSLVASSPQYVFTSQDTGGAFITLPIFESLNPGNYFVGLREFVTTDNIGLGQNFNIFTPQKAWVNINNSGWTTSESQSFPGAFLIRPNFGPTSTGCPVITVNISSQNEICGNAGGSATASPSGGTAPYNYSWSNGGSGSSISNLSAGTITVTVTDANQCTATETVNITNNNITLNVTTTTTNTSCNASNGSATASASGGASPYNFSWSNGQSGSTISNLSAGTFTVTATDANGCSGTATANISASGAPVVSVTKNDISCNGANDGSATASASGGTGSFSYSWSNGGNSATISGLSAGTYTVTVTDNGNQCSATNSVTINEPSPLTATLSTSSVTCNGGNDGSVTASANGGTSPYGYTWNTGDTGPNLTNISAGQYTVTVSDNNNCTITETTTVTQPNGFTINTTSQDANCGANDGSATANVTPTGNYSYQWSDPNNQSSATATSLSAGSYTVTVTNNSNSCQQTASVIVGSIGGPSANISNKSDVSCNGGSDGSATVSATGGTGTLSYSWSNSGSTPQITGLSAGSYTVTVTDQNSCIAVATVSINEPQALSISFLTTDVSCFGGSDGSVTINATGGTQPYQYSINGGALMQSATFNSLSSGQVTATVRDNNGCTVNNNVTISQPSPLSASTSSTDVSCNGGNDGMASVTPSGGTSPYSFSWSNGQSSNAISNVAAGNYMVTINDANNCSTTANATVNEPQALTASSSINNNVSCNGGSDGSATIGASGGTPPYEYSIDGGVTFVSNNTFTGISAGAQTVNVRDDNGCITDVNFTISEPNALTASISSTSDISCNGAADGSVTLNASGGTTPYEYSTDGSNFQSSNSFSNLGQGSLTIFVEDANNCQTTVNTTINEPAALSVDTNSVTDATAGNSDGAIDLTVSGGTTPYNYSWSNNETTQNISGLSPGNYSVTVTDSNGCTATKSIVVDQSVGIETSGLSSNLDIFPNPTDGNVNIQLQLDEPSDFTIEVYDVLGQTIMKRNLQEQREYSQQFDFSHSSSGLYFVKITLGSKSFTKKIVVNH